MLTATEQFTPAARDPQVREFSAGLRQMQSDLAKMTAGERVAQAGFTSIEDAALPVFDALGQVRMSLGKQNDGTFAVVYVDGPPPPKPNQPIVAARQLGVYVAVDGTFAGGYARPADVARFDVHMSTTSGFTCDGTTIVGDVTEAGGVLIGGVANVTQYVKVVAVSRAKDSTTGAVIASPPTDEIAVLPLPISQIAVGAIGAQQFAADIGFVSRLLVGNPNAGHVELEGRDGMTPGLHAYDGGLTPTFDLDAITGNVTMRGALRSADSGERMIWREYSWANDIRFYPKTGANYARLRSQTYSLGGTDSAGLYMQSPPYPGTSERNFIEVNAASAILWAGNGDPDKVVPVQSGGAVAVNSDGASLQHWVNDSSTRGGYLYTSLDNVSMGVGGAGQVALFPTGAQISHPQRSLALNLGNLRWVFGYNTTSGTPYLYSAGSTKAGIEFRSTGVDIWNSATGAYLAVGASAFVTQSARDTKTEIEDLPFDPERVIVGAPVTMWERLAEQRDEHGRFRRAQKYLGPMAEDVPEVLRVTVGGEPGLDLGRNLGVVWAATARQTARLDALEARLDDLEAA